MSPSTTQVTDATGHTLSRRFDSQGVYEYVCHPRKAMGMKGAIVVK
ncbi:MAG: plastocyanin/azurin family copper-binding protein [Halobacteriales archaeon]